MKKLPPENEDIAGFVARFKSNRKDHFKTGYKEHQLRREFVDPLFSLLGWDVGNLEGKPSTFKDVIHEDTVKVEGGHKAPDYGFYIDGQRKFFVEAKSPLAGVASPTSALQLRRYGWSAGVLVSILTDIETLVVYDCRIQPENDQTAGYAQLTSFVVDEYVSRWDEIQALLSRSAVERGSLPSFVLRAGTASGHTPVDQAFLLQIDSWRGALAKAIAKDNTFLSVGDLNTSVQLILDRIIFLRIAEDRAIEPVENLLRVTAEAPGVYRRLVEVFKRADSRYNSGLFHLIDDGQDGVDNVTTRLNVADNTVRAIIKGLYKPESHYEFSVMPAEILGQVYEQFLGKVIRLSKGSAVVEDKPEVKKAGGVYYTPSDIVRQMVDFVLSPFLTGVPPLKRKETKDLVRIIDPACGSGSFLIEAYRRLLDWHLLYYTNTNPERFSSGRLRRLIRVDGDWKLSIAEKRRILLDHLYGVDIDPQAVEVTRLSLLLKMLEGETGDRLAAQMNLFETRALPDLSGNIKSGNSLVGTDIVPGLLLTGGLSDIDTNNPFDWENEFPFLRKSGGFDVLIGNPPYIDSEWMTKHWPLERSYCTAKYEFATGNWDIFCAFIGKSCDVLSAGGGLALIVPNKLMTADYAKATRKYLAKKGFISRVRDYSSIAVFPVSVYPIIFTFEKGAKQSPTEYAKVINRTFGISVASEVLKVSLPTDGTEWRFASSGLDEKATGLVPLSSLATVCDAATVAEAYELKPLLIEKETPNPKDLRLLNSGTIDPYVSLWGVKKTRYVNSAYEFPVLGVTAQRNFSKRRVDQARTPKIIVANMTLKIEAMFDESGSILGGKSVTLVILGDYSPWIVLAVLNSKMMSAYFDRRFVGARLAGGYLQVSPSRLGQLPFPKTVKKTVCSRIEALCRLLVKLKDPLVTRSGHAETLHVRQVSAVIDNIEAEVCALYPERLVAKK